MTSRLAILLCVMTWSACSSSTSPSPPPPATSTTCTPSTTMTFLFPGTPGEGTPFVQYFASVVVPAQSTVYFVDVTTSPLGCFTAWTAVASNIHAVNISPAGGNGRGRVELFMPLNTGPARQTTVTIAGQVATILQAGQ